MEHSLTSAQGWDDTIPPPEKPRYFALSRTTDRVLQILLSGDLSRLRADSVAEELGMSSTTLRRRLRADHTCYQFLLDRARSGRPEFLEQAVDDLLREVRHALLAELLLRRQLVRALDGTQLQRIQTAVLLLIDPRARYNQPR